MAINTNWLGSYVFQGRFCSQYEQFFLNFMSIELVMHEVLLSLWISFGNSKEKICFEWVLNSLRSEEISYFWPLFLITVECVNTQLDENFIEMKRILLFMLYIGIDSELPRKKRVWPLLWWEQDLPLLAFLASNNLFIIKYCTFKRSFFLNRRRVSLVHSHRLTFQLQKSNKIMEQISKKKTPKVCMFAFHF